jgi:hypothetical protein
VFRFEVGDTVTAPMGHFGNVAYIGAHDSNLYALEVGVAGNLPAGKLRWRFTAGGPITRAPVALDNDVYVTTADSGLTRVDRATGEARWRVPRGGRLFNSNPDADRFVAANPKFVYAMDPRGRLLVLDRRLGTTLSAYDVRDFVFPITNQQNDRLYLAANDGLLVCLHDRDYPTPFDQRTQEAPVSAALKKILAQPVTVTEPREVPLRDLLDDYKRRYKLNYEIAERAFKEAGLEPVGGKPVKPPAVKDVPLETLLRQVLRQVGADFQIIEDTVLVFPSRKQPAPAAPLPAPGGEERKP